MELAIVDSNGISREIDISVNYLPTLKRFEEDIDTLRQIKFKNTKHGKTK